jgi:hypothetical protein
MPRLTAIARSRREGVTLIEVVIAIFVLSIGIMGIMSLFPAGYKLTRRSVERSVAALAARHALARVVGKTDQLSMPAVDAEALSNVFEAHRVGTVSGVEASWLHCKILGGAQPSSWQIGGADDQLQGYYLVMTSGSANGHFYKIAENKKTDSCSTCPSPTNKCQRLRFYSDIKFNTGQEKRYEPVRVGDHFALIGSKTGSKCYPLRFLGDTLGGGELRTMPVATYGDPNAPKDTWRYSYGCIISAPAPEMTETFRLDVFVYRGFPYKCPPTVGGEAVVPKQINQLAVGHYVAYMSGGKVGGLTGS